MVAVSLKKNFFQAEDGIRDTDRSRGLGDVYKRQLPLMQRLGAVLGWVVWCLSPSYRRNFKANVQAAGVAWRDARPAVAAIGAMVAELPWVWMRPHAAKLDGLMAWDGTEHFEAAMKAGKGAIIMSPHIGSWEIGAQAIAEKFGPTADGGAVSACTQSMA